MLEDFYEAKSAWTEAYHNAVRLGDQLALANLALIRADTFTAVRRAMEEMNLRIKHVNTSMLTDEELKERGHDAASRTDAG